MESASHVETNRPIRISKVHLNKNTASFKEIWEEKILGKCILKWHFKDISVFWVIVQTIKSSQLIAPTHSPYCILAEPCPWSQCYKQCKWDMIWNSDVKEVLECSKCELTREMKPLCFYYYSTSTIIIFL